MTADPKLPVPGTPIKTSLMLTAQMRKEMELCALTLYGSRGQARWTEEALEALVNEPNYMGLVGAGEGTQSFPERKVLRLSPHAQERLDEAVRDVRRLAPTLESVRSAVLRAAIGLAIRRQAANSDAPVPRVPSKKPATEAAEAPLKRAKLAKR